MGKNETQFPQIDYQHYRFGRSRQRFRGPKPDLTKPYVSFVGGSETYGKFSVLSYPEVLQRELGMTCANWGTPGAGPWFFLKDPVILEGCSLSRVCVVSLMGAIPNSNRLYSVFKRRNARVREATPELKALFPDLNLNGYRFANNMLRAMHKSNRANFKLVELEIKKAWVARMRELLCDIETRKILLWFSTRAPGEKDRTNPFDRAPTFISEAMVNEVAKYADEVVEVVTPEQTIAEAGLDRVFFQDEEHAALLHPGASQHELAAKTLLDPLKALVRKRIQA